MLPATRIVHALGGSETIHDVVVGAAKTRRIRSNQVRRNVCSTPIQTQLVFRRAFSISLVSVVKPSLT